MLRFGPEEMTSCRGVEEAEQGEEPEGEGTGSTELSDIRLLGRSFGGLRESCVSCCGSSAVSRPLLGDKFWLPEAIGRWYCVVPVGMCQK